MGLLRNIAAIFPPTPSTRKHIAAIRDHLSKSDAAKAIRLMRRQEIRVAYAQFGLSPWISGDTVYPQFHVLDGIPVDRRVLETWNTEMQRRAQRSLIEAFAPRAADVLPLCVAPNIEGLDIIKQAVALQLVCRERIHILLLGDPGTGKTDVIRSAASLHSSSSFGLGSGMSGVGLTVSVKGQTVTPGLLVQAHKGICALDELNLIKHKDIGSLYNAMEKGFITYNKADKQITMDAQVRVLATANPKGDRFVGKGIAILRDQLPFDSALLSRFHLVFLLRAPTLERFVAITKKIVSEKDHTITPADRTFISAYVEYVERQEVEFPAELQDTVVGIIEQYKKQESKYLQEISPRAVHGLIRLARSHARLSMRRKVVAKDIDAAKAIMDAALEVV